ncbi:hypothetical protein AB2T63_02320 [Clostridium butyricum]|jgi:cAMP phosphodiesterase|uniref:Uncharacterized protein n=1 Tax=Clostridium butyricum TaxID=1492 RepID=A0A6L9ELI7_CLOBU|nr:hypothetical protein [Clostridium butyricum]ETI91055.1 MAG: hypothetical protein Q607_CBUC00036G0002 [Clostridium butyricum DORA_1]ALP89606.1 hypothetical protein ATN24_05510 [Clostridium butyricum]ALS16061.1 hypothetical protein ATD26_04070 [Clostridium butyricum]ANF13219.1 hypothetical protein AZ909_03950 [Clostridium butyricum]AOR93290.1 hypothetical protein BBB49_04135 [Clostridium butyricum]
MSLFLGKIHYWLFNKIVWFENLEREILNLASSVEIDVNNIEKEIEKKYGKMLPNRPLEEIIDTSNIHGWLQERIHNAEGRMASWTRAIIVNDVNDVVKIQNIYITQGIKAANEVKNSNTSFDTAYEIYSKINDYILDGMPCDRVDEIIVNEDDIITWKKRICVHKEIWERENIDVEQFYNLRDLWIKAFVNTINDQFKYIKNDDGTFSIKR